MSVNPTLRQRLEFSLLPAFEALVRVLPHRAARGLGAMLGELVRLVDPWHPRIARANLLLAMPELSPADRRRIAARCYRHMGGVISDTLSLARFDAAGICRCFTLEGWEHLTEAGAGGAGYFVVTAHLGNWEVVGDALALYQGSTHIVARPSRNPLVERKTLRIRERFGNRTLYRRGVALKMMRAVRGGGRVAFLIDQRVHPNEGIEVPFFGQPSWTSPLLAGLSLRSGAPVVPVFGLPTAGGRFRIVARPPISPRGKGKEAVGELTALYLSAIEAEIRKRPEQWLWMHERWRKH